MKSIILLHGALGSQEQMLPLTKILSKEYDVHVFDLSGHGKKCNENCEFSIGEMTNELDEYNTLNELKNPIVFGYSMGGYVALNHALQFPGKIVKIITLATKFDWSVESAERESKQLDVEMMKSKIPDFVNVLKGRHGDHWENVVSKTARMMIELGNLKPLNDHSLSKISTDTMLCIGDKDKMVSLTETENTAKFLPKGKVKILIDTAHPFERVDYEKLAGVIKEFIDSSTSSLQAI